ncbi:hypothetical protein AB0F68_06965 [Micromonospora sp. NPDC023966]|uniref:DUF3885 domain-containing protein n=1 Tax=Micromonospora sp. NPDC023966 TaxID=3154699 RepID=UPI0033F44C3E
MRPDDTFWTGVCSEDGPGFESWMHVYVSGTAWSVGCLDRLLRHVADDVIANVLVADCCLRCYITLLAGHEPVLAFDG